MKPAVAAAAMVADPFAVALGLHRQGELGAAESAYAAILATHPRHAGALMGLGLVAHQRSDTSRAVALLEEARRLAPRDPAILNNLGLALAAAGRDGDAQSAWRRALTIEPRFSDALVNLANADVHAGRPDEAMRRYRAALAADPRCLGAAANLGGLLLARRRYGEALRYLETAAALDPASADIRVNIGRALSECGWAGKAREALQNAVRLRPGDRAAASNLLLALHYCDDLDAITIADAHRAWGRTQEPDGPRPRPAVAAGRAARFRVGLLSGDFNDHAVMRFLAPVLETGSSGHVELHCYYTGSREDAMTAEVRRSAAAFASVGELAVPALAERLRADDLDILIDLSGHSAGGRPEVLALRPVPLQATWLGYLGTTGLSAVDFRLTDAIDAPPALMEPLHTERLWRLPAMWCYRPRASAPAPGASPAMSAGHITFGSTNNPAKLSDATLSLWAMILARIPTARLALHAHDDPLCRDRIARAFAESAIAPDRLTWLGREQVDDYLLRYREIDILLDTTPFSGGTTTCDALWMGVPVVTLAGDRPFSRTSASVLHAAGFAQWIADDRDGYARIALSLAGDVVALAAVRATIREKVARSRLCDERAMADDFAAALPAMWAAAGLPARAAA